MFSPGGWWKYAPGSRGGVESERRLVHAQTRVEVPPGEGPAPLVDEDLVQHHAGVTEGLILAGGHVAPDPDMEVIERLRRWCGLDA
jgi:hypothetical protein